MSQQQKQNSKVNAMLQGIPFQNTGKTEKSMTTPRNQSCNYIKGSLANIKPQIKRTISSLLFCCKLDTVLAPDIYNCFNR